MDIEIRWPGRSDEEKVNLDVGAANVICGNVYCGIGIKTNFGYFGIAERDGVIEVVFNGKLIIDSDNIKKLIEDTLSYPEVKG